MFASYSYNAGITAAQMLSDIVAILTGTTDVNSLSAGCNKAASAIYTGYSVAGWTVHDAAAGTNVQVLKALCNDGVTYKYLRLDLNTASTIRFTGYEAWDAVAHTGTNACQGSTALVNRLIDSLTISGYLYIYATERNFVLWFKNTGTVTPIGGIIEWTREGVLMAQGLGYPCWACCSTNSYSYPPRGKNPTGAGDHVANTACTIVPLNPAVLNSPSMVGMNAYRDASEVIYYESFQTNNSTLIFQSSSSGSSPFAYNGKLLFDGLISEAGAILDETVVSGKTYVKMGNYQPVLGWNSGSLWVPKG